MAFTVHLFERDSEKNGMLATRINDDVSPAEHIRVLRLFAIGLLLRLAIAAAFQLTSVEQRLSLTKDASLYDRVGKKIAQYYRSEGDTKWPGRVSGFLDHLYEHVVGFTYYLTNDSVLAVRLFNVLCGSLVVLVTWRMARYITDSDTAFRCAIWACFFPTLVYYSCLPVRDAQSALAMALVFLGMTAIACSGQTRHSMVLPFGLFLMAGYRTYIATALFVLVPLSWLLTLLVTRSKSSCPQARRGLLVGVLAAVASGAVAVPIISSTRKAKMVTDVNSWNSVRQQLNSGRGAFYEAGSVPSLDESVIETAQSIAFGLYFFFLSVNPTEITSVRQWMALPEVLIVLYMIPSLIRGSGRVIRHHRFEFVSTFFVAAAISLAYASVTTNAGPLMRWRLQVVPVYIVIAAIGFAKAEQPQNETAGSQ